MRVALVGCGERKVDHEVPARDLYVGRLFRYRLDYVLHADFDRWFILSAKHHLLDPDLAVAPYDVSLVGRTPAELRLWSRVVVRQLVGALGGVEGAYVELHAGKEYREHGVADRLRAAGADVVNPLDGLPKIGFILQWYADRRSERAGEHVPPRSHGRT